MKYIEGDLIQLAKNGKFNVIVHGCNCFNTMGAGIAKMIKDNFIGAWKADQNGNLLYRQSARNFNPIMATASKVTIVEVEEILPVGSLNPDEVHTPGIFVDRIVKGEDPTKPIEILKIRK